MSALPTIKMVSECLKKFCEARGSRYPSPPPPEIAKKTIDLDCNIPLPPEWEQWLDIKTGDLYYINKKTGMRTDKDPRETPGESYYSWESSDDDGSDDSSDDDDSDGGNNNIIDCNNSNNNEQSSGSVIPAPPSSGEVIEPTRFLVVVVCKTCYTYMMVADETKDCPKCGGPLVHFSRERCF